MHHDPDALGFQCAVCAEARIEHQPITSGGFFQAESADHILMIEVLEPDRLQILQQKAYDHILGANEITTVINLIGSVPGVDSDNRFTTPFEMDLEHLSVMERWPVTEPVGQF